MEPHVRSKIMCSIHSKNTKPEILLRRALWARGHRYRVNYTKLIGRPDIVFLKLKTCIFVDGDFWHGNNWRLRGMESLDVELDSYSDFWRTKIVRNMERDLLVTSALKDSGWKVVRLWASDVIHNISECVMRIESELMS